MSLTLMLIAQAAALAAPGPAPDSPPPPVAPYALPGEEVVAPYTASPANAGARPFTGPAMAAAFHGQPGIQRIVDRFVVLAYADPVIGEIFKGHDRARLRRTLFEQFCFILDAGCSYSGRDMKSAHKDLGVQQADMNRLVELVQQAMREEGVSFAAQNRFLSKLAPMRPAVLQR